MQQYFGVKKDGKKLILNSEDFNHIKNVMRMKENDKVIVNYDGISYICSLNKDLLSCEIDSVFKQSNDKGSIIAYVPLLQEEKMSLVLQKGTELGVDEFVVVYFEHCKFKLPKKDYEKKLLRWNKIVKEASEQSYRVNKVIVREIIGIDQIVLNTNVNILCSLVKNNVKHISDILNTKNCNDTISLVFGPEGGFTNKEEEKLISKGFIRTSLGPNVLRTETVIMFIMSIVMYLKGSANDE
ncbi:MAG: 16S rRNA (uracil(1498)-N(3))-methyltransferase [Bacilli bacterium]|nr:16S rRNA (uracil(1498)-N(3))-methyltransferase [Bacilli bacterium]